MHQAISTYVLCFVCPGAQLLNCPFLRQVALCPTCYRSLRNGPVLGKKGAAEPLPPRLAICNNWAVLCLPQSILDMKPTHAELSCTALAQVAVKYHVIGKEKNIEKRSITSHALIFQSAQPAASMFPRTVDNQEYFVIFANMSTEEVQIEKRNRLLVRSKVTDALLQHYRISLEQYQRVPTNNDAFFGPGSLQP